MLNGSRLDPRRNSDPYLFGPTRHSHLASIAPQGRDSTLSGRYWWCNGRKWQPRVASDGIWNWDGYRWNLHSLDAHPETTSESLGRALIDPNPGAWFDRETVISLVVAMVLVALSIAINPLAHTAADHTIIGAIAFVATRSLLSRGTKR